MKTVAPKIEVPLEGVDVLVYCIPTEGPESDRGAKTHSWELQVATHKRGVGLALTAAGLALGGGWCAYRWLNNGHATEKQSR